MSAKYSAPSLTDALMWFLSFSTLDFQTQQQQEQQNNNSSNNNNNNKMGDGLKIS